MSRGTTALLLLMLGTTAAAQPLQQLPFDPHQHPRTRHHTPVPEDPPVIHVTHWLDRLPESQQALEAYHARKAKGLLPPAAKTAAAYDVGDTQTFRVWNFDTQQFDLIQFTLKAEGEQILLWVETAELDNEHVRDQDVEALRSALEDETPAGSTDPGRGILSIDESVFGTPPLTGKLNVLLVDIRDGRSEDEGYIAGFVHSADLSSTGNQKRVLYLDTQPGLFSDEGEYRGTHAVQQTAAHEYQHLIHYNYDRNEGTFVNEGLSEYAEVLNGYTARSAGYLSDPLRYNVPFYRWSTGLAGEILDDYQRAGLFTNYLGDRIGVAAAGSITREGANGSEGYQAVLDDLDQPLQLADVLADFHTANILNDDVDGSGRFAYTTEQRRGTLAETALLADGRTQTQTPTTRDTVRAGAVLYLNWTYVQDFNLTLDVDPISAGAAETYRSRTRLRAILEFSDGTIQTRDFAPESAPETFEGAYRQITVMVAHVQADAAFQAGTPIAYAADWTEHEGGSFTSASVSYDDGQADHFVLVSDEVTTLFENPAPKYSILSGVSLPVYYASQFGNTDVPATAPRDFTLVVREATPEGAPGDALFTLTLDDARPYSEVNSLQLAFAELDLAAYADQLNALPHRFFVGFKNTGPDDNQIAFASSSYAEENLSFSRSGAPSFSWSRLWDVELQDNTSLSGTIIPVRAAFLISSTKVPVEGEVELPAEVVLAQNYPNPFNPATTIRYSLPAAAEVQLAVFDLLGRRLATLVDAVQPAGTHVIHFDAADWPSGVYFYRLTTGATQLTQRMMLMK